MINKQEIIKNVNQPKKHIDSIESMVSTLSKRLDEINSAIHIYETDSLEAIVKEDYTRFFCHMEWMIEVGRDIQRIALDARKKVSLLVMTRIADKNF
jgi:hypothetical protein